jgi:hypothetical protein
MTNQVLPAQSTPSGPYGRVIVTVERAKLRRERWLRPALSQEEDRVLPHSLA